MPDRIVEPSYFDQKTTRTQEQVSNKKGGAETITRKTAETENVTEGPALDPRTGNGKTTKAFVIDRS